MAIEGDLGAFRLTDILQVIAHQHKTGILTLQGEREILAISFLRGQIVAADALNQPFEENLGKVLASQGWVRPEDLSELVRQHAAVGGRFSDFLLAKGVLDQARLLEAMRLQIYRLILEALRWRSGEFKFYSGDEVAHEPGIVPIPVEELLFRAMSDLIGEGTLSGTVPHGFVAYEALPPSLPVRVGFRELGEARDESAIWISPEEERLYRLLDGSTPAAELARRTGLGEYKTLYALFRLLQLRLARPASADLVFPQEPTGPSASAPAVVQPPRAASVLASSAREEPVLKKEASPRWESQTLADPISVGVAILFGLVGLMVLYQHPASGLVPAGLAAGYQALVDRTRELAELQVLDRSLRTHFLLEGRFPETLSELRRRGLLAAHFLSDLRSGGWMYQSQGEAYVVRPRNRSSGEFHEGILGDLVLDSKLYQSLEAEGRVPLLLLD
jgi:hypothetical protein